MVLSVKWSLFIYIDTIQAMTLIFYRVIVKSQNESPSPPSKNKIILRECNTTKNGLVSVCQLLIEGEDKMIM